MLLYPVYALLFADTGLSVAQTSSLFVLWSAAGIALEVPSGAWADAVSRRLLLIAGPFLTAVGFLLWVLVPSYGAFAAGFVLWGVKGAFCSGALEALVYEELDRLGAADSYAAVMGRAQAAGTVATVLAMGLAAPVMAAGGYLGVGLASVLACVLTALVAMLFPEYRANGSDVGPGPEQPDEDAGYLDTLRAGLREARADRPVRRAVLLVPAVAAIWGALDEFTPLLIRDTGVTENAVPLLLLVLYLGVAAGGLLAAWTPVTTARRLGLLLLAAAPLAAAGALSGAPAGVVPLGLAFCAFQLATVAADARLQARIAGSARATVTSLAGLATDLASIAVYAVYAVASRAGHGAAFALLAVLYVPLAAGLMSPRARRDRRRTPSAPQEQPGTAHEEERRRRSGEHQPPEPEHP